MQLSARIFPELLFFILLFYLSISTTALAHPGGLDSSGGHNDKKNGGYHYHSTPRQSASHKPSKTKSSYKKSQGLKTTNQITQKKVHGVKVIGYMDGDTIKVVRNGKQEKIRLYGIDTPEKKQAYGQAATAAIKQILTGRDIKIEIIDHDRYGRAVAMVYADGKNVNEIMVKGGYAWVYRKYCKDSFCNDWLEHEKQAKQSKRALWKDSNPEPPWEWRH